MRRWDAQQIARLAGARLLQSPPAGGSGPTRATIDSRDAGPGAVFVGLPGERTHGGSHALEAVAAGAWGVLTTPEHARATLAGIAGVAAGGPAGPAPASVPAGSAPASVPAGSAPASVPAGSAPAILSAEDPLVALQRLATAWRRELGAQVIGVTGSTGKTSTKDLLAAVLSPHRLTVASRANFNTEIGLPLEILAAPAGTEILVLEMGMRGPGQIAELARVAEPDVGVIVSVGPVHLEQMHTIEAIVAAKAELIAGLPAGGTAVLPADEPLLAPHRRSDIATLTFGPGGDVTIVREREDGLEIDCAGERLALSLNLSQSHLRRNLLAAVAAAKAVGVRAGGRLHVTLSPGRGQRTALRGDVTLIDDTYNANPVSMRAALDELADTAERLGRERRTAQADPERSAECTPRRVAVLGDMLELGDEARGYHAEIGAYATATADVLVTVGPLAAFMADRFAGEHHHADDAGEAAVVVSGLLQDGDVVLVKASNAIGLRQVCDVLRAGASV